MNRISDNDIFNFLEEKYEFILNKYKRRKILGIFALGNVNYGFADSVQDCHLVAIYVPDFEELCFGTPLEKQVDGIRMVDVRLIYDAMTANNYGYALELLFSNYSIIIPEYRDIFIKFFLNNKDIIASYNKGLRISKLLNRAYIAKDNQNYFELARIGVECEAFANDAPSEEWFRPSSPALTSYLWGVKDRLITISCDDIIDNIKMCLVKVADTPQNEKAYSLVKEGVLKIMDISLYKEIDADEFLKCLTETEKSALTNLEKYLVNGMGNIIITKVTDETNISRPVYKSLFQKMENYNVAKITNMGVKGTYIEILDKTILINKG